MTCTVCGAKGAYRKDLKFQQCLCDSHYDILKKAEEQNEIRARIRFGIVAAVVGSPFALKRFGEDLTVSGAIA